MKFFIFIFVLLAPSLALTEIEKIATPCENGMCFHWWPKLHKVEGWSHDRSASLANNINIQTIEGSNFSNSGTVIYARAIYKPRRPEIKSLSQLIEHDKTDFQKSENGITIKPSKSLSTSLGDQFETLTFFPATQGNWEQVAYGEEDDFYLLFIISSRTKEGYLSSLPAYTSFINSYQ